MRYGNIGKDLEKGVAVKKVTSRSIFLVLILIIIAIVMSIIRLIAKWLLVKEPVPVKASENFVAIKDTKEDSTSYVVTRNQETPPLTMGPRRLHYIFATALPQTYLTLLSVLQGLVFGVLLLKIPLHDDPSLTTIFTFSLQQHLYLPYITSSLVILIIWNQIVHGVLFLAWPFTVFQSSLIFLMSLVEILTFTRANVLPVWLFGLGWIAIVGALIRFNNIRYLPDDKQSWVALNKYAIFSKKREITDGTYYLSLSIIVLTLSLTFNYFIGIARGSSNLLPAIITWAINILIFMMAVSILIIDKKNRHIYLDLFVEGSDLVVSSHGVVSYSKDSERVT